LQAHGKKQSSLVVGGSAGNNSQGASIEVFMAHSKVSLYLHFMIFWWVVLLGFCRKVHA
jgi:hypothetical protein